MKNNRNSNKKKGAFLLRPVQVQNGRKNRLTAFLTDVCFVWLYLAGMTFWLESSLQLDISIGICLLAALAAAPLQQPGGGGAADAEGALQILLIDFPALAVAEITDQNALDLRQHALGMVGRPPKPSAQEIGQCLDLIPDVPLMLHGNTSSN